MGLQSHGTTRELLDTRTARFKSALDRGNAIGIWHKLMHLSQKSCEIFVLCSLAVIAVSCGEYASVSHRLPVCSALCSCGCHTTGRSISVTTPTSPAHPSTSDGEQTKRILALFPNFRSVPVDAKQRRSLLETSSN